MYFEGKLTIDPSELTKIERLKPTKAFKRLAYYLTLGGVSDKEEVETYTALSILQQLYGTFSDSRITNIVRLSHDDIDFYLDQEGVENDLKDALDKYDLEIDQSMATHFNKLVLILEHEDVNFKYLFEVIINRNHEVGAYPIEINITGLFRGLGTNNTEITSNLEQVFSTQENYNQFKLQRREAFEAFVHSFEQSIRKTMKVDDVKSSLRTKMVVPKAGTTANAHTNYRDDGYYGVHYGYHGFDDELYYTSHWLSMSTNYVIIHEDTYFESYNGNSLGHLSELDSSTISAEDITDSGTFVESFRSDDWTSTDSSDSSDSSSDSSSDTSSDSSSSSWFDSDSSSDTKSNSWFDSFDSSDSSSDSSCSSCSSCGGD